MVDVVEEGIDDGGGRVGVSVLGSVVIRVGDDGGSRFRS